jgi:hypothetical protein
MNTLYQIAPYKHDGMWVFDDDRFGLVREALVEGIPEIIEKACYEQNIPDPSGNVVVTFASVEFPNWTIKMDLLGEAYGGHEYIVEDWGMKGWLCPALLHYFSEAPETIYVRAERKPE